MCGELKRLGYDVDLFTLHQGFMSKRIKKDFGINQKLKDSYDLILASHNTTVERVFELGKTIQTCHGTIPNLEQPNKKADRFVAISEEVKNHLSGYGIESSVILNGVDCKRFRPIRKIKKSPEKILSMVHSEEANSILEHACKMLGIKLLRIDKYNKPVFGVQRSINVVDMVVTLGRGAYESMACGRPVIVFDKRKYQDSLADGYLDLKAYQQAINNNLSGRTKKLGLDSLGIFEEIKKYDYKDGERLRNLALKEHNIEIQVQKYLNL
jgi:glycosyltransferase involved in cell wall biosynthesis